MPQAAARGRTLTLQVYVWRSSGSYHRRFFLDQWPGSAKQQYVRHSHFPSDTEGVDEIAEVYQVGFLLGRLALEKVGSWGASAACFRAACFCQCAVGADL